MEQILETETFLLSKMWSRRYWWETMKVRLLPCPNSLHHHIDPSLMVPPCEQVCVCASDCFPVWYWSSPCHRHWPQGGLNSSDDGDRQPLAQPAGAGQSWDGRGTRASFHLFGLAFPMATRCTIFVMSQHFLRNRNMAEKQRHRVAVQFLWLVY